MKKVLTVAFAAVLAITFASCKKEYTCACTYNDSMGTTMSTAYTIKDTKSNADKACTGYEVAVPGASAVWSCDLK